jgi:hypothetical protein
MNKKKQNKPDIQYFRTTDHFPDIRKMVAYSPRRGTLIQPRATLWDSERATLLVKQEGEVFAAKDHFVDVNKTIERRITSEDKKALKKPDTLESE